MYVICVLVRLKYRERGQQERESGKVTERESEYGPDLFHQPFVICVRCTHKTDPHTHTRAHLHVDP